MVSLTDVLASNAKIPSSLPKRLIAVFAGATSGIGETTLKTLIKYAIQPRIYLFARNPTSAERVIAECRQINPLGEYIFVNVNLRSVKETDQACEQVRSKEKLVNLVVLSAGEVIWGRDRKLRHICDTCRNIQCEAARHLQQEVTPEGLNVFLAASTYTRIRMVQQLLPLLTIAASTTPLARVVNIAGGTYEGDIDRSDVAALNIPFTKLRAQLTSIHTLALETLAQQAPTVSFVHDYPGSVYTNLHKDATGGLGLFYRTVITILHAVLGNWMFIPLQECGERHVFFATSDKYGPRDGSANGVPHERLKTAEGSDGTVGSGVYSVNWNGEKRTENSVHVLKSTEIRV